VSEASQEQPTFTEHSAPVPVPVFQCGNFSIGFINISFSTNGFKMNMKELLFLLIYVAGMSAGQLLFKLSAKSFKESQNSGENLVVSMLNWNFTLAVFLYAALTIYWVWLLTFIPLSKGYPFVAVSIAITVIASWRIFGEQLSVIQLVGFGSILIGVTMMTWGKN